MWNPTVSGPEVLFLRPTLSGLGLCLAGLGQGRGWQLEAGCGVASEVVGDELAVALRVSHFTAPCSRDGEMVTWTLRGFAPSLW